MQSHRSTLLRLAELQTTFTRRARRVASISWLAMGAAGCQPSPATAPDEATQPTETASLEAPAASPLDAAKQAAMASAQAWLVLVDQGQYPESWDAAASIFQSATTKEQWQGAVTSAREPLGALSSRKLRVTEHKTSLPGAPEGNYVLVHYDSVFAGKPAAVESVTVMQEPDQSWKVAGYFIQ